MLTKQRVNNEQRQQRADEDQDRLDELNATLALALTPYFAAVARQTRNTFLNTGQTFDSQELRPRLESILKSHYRNVYDEFEGDFLRRNELDLTQTQQADFAARFRDAKDEFGILQSDRQSSIITSTNQRQINKGVRDSLIAAAGAIAVGEQMSQADIAQSAQDNFERASGGRIGNIAESETQDAGENAKLDDAKLTAAATVGIAVANRLLRKQWWTRLDNKVRPAHVGAQGQVQIIGDPFIVGGQRLQRPRDTSLGATIDNVARCRCNIIYLTPEQV